MFEYYYLHYYGKILFVLDDGIGMRHTLLAARQVDSDKLPFGVNESDPFPGDVPPPGAVVPIHRREPAYSMGPSSMMYYARNPSVGEEVVGVQRGVRGPVRA